MTFYPSIRGLPWILFYNRIPFASQPALPIATAVFLSMVVFNLVGAHWLRPDGWLWVEIRDGIQGYPFATSVMSAPTNEAPPAPDCAPREDR